MRTAEIATQLRRTNRWWQFPEAWADRDPDLRDAASAAFDYEPRPLDGLRPGGLYLLRGPRRVGKSVEVKRAIRRLLDLDVDPRAIVHASCDGWSERDLGALLDAGRGIATRGVAGPRYWFLDEITGVGGNWPERIKWLRDNTEMKEDCVVLTGSSARNLDACQKVLAGRRGDASDPDRTLLPMSFGAFCRAIGETDLPYPDGVPANYLMGRAARDAIDKLTPWLNELTIAWEAQLLIGGFPRAVDDLLRSGGVHPERMTTFSNIVHGEAFRSGAFTRTQTRALLARLTAGLAAPVNVSAVARDVDSGFESIRARLDDLVAAYIAWPCHQEVDGAPRLRAQAKLYFIDPLFARLASAQWAPEPDLSILSEQQIGVALLRHFEANDRGTFPVFDSVLYARTQTRREIDFVSPRHDAVPVESKYVDSRWRREAQILRTRFGRGIIATRSALDIDGEVWAVPAPIVALLLEPTG